MRLLSFGLAFVLMLSLTAAPVLTLAQTGVPDSLVPCKGLDCNFCSLVKLAQNILNFSIYLAVIMAALAFAYAGGLYLTSSQNPDHIRQAKAMFQYAGLGMLFILGAWILVDTILAGLLKVDLGSLNSGCRL